AGANRLRPRASGDASWGDGRLGPASWVVLRWPAHLPAAAIPAAQAYGRAAEYRRPVARRGVRRPRPAGHAGATDRPGLVSPFCVAAGRGGRVRRRFVRCPGDAGYPNDAASRRYWAGHGWWWSPGHRRTSLRAG